MESKLHQRRAESGQNSVKFEDDDLMNKVGHLVDNIEGTLDTIDDYVNVTDEMLTLYNFVLGFKKYTKSSEIVSLLEAKTTLKGETIGEKLIDGLKLISSKIESFESNPKPSDMTAVREEWDDEFRKIVELGRSRLLHYNELPDHWKENHHIRLGYRFHDDYVAFAASIFGWHNETSNIWTHLLGALFMFYLSGIHFPSTELFQTSSTKDIVMIYVFMAAAIKCLVFSVTWHTLNGTCKQHHRSKFACVDYTGITVLITASILTTEYAALYHHPWLLTTFVSFSSLCGFLGVLLNWSPTFDRPESRFLRIGFFLSLSGLGVSAALSLAWYKGLMHALWFYGPLARSFVWYLTGVYFYGSFFPERFRDPNDDKHMWWVDYVLSSHNLWHVFVVGGILGHYSAIREMFANIPLNM